ncbi:hypothetical protein WME90_07145 [Sorangium sp. So ce375]|uniref:tetratricopeptide repeat protein n=1 Tax=Sorangium sp. So ce375 TaxID=3133306 RepID=UPI003F5B9388
MQGRPQLIEQVVGAVHARKPDVPVRRLLRVAPGGEGRWFVQMLTAALENVGRRVIPFDLPAYDIDAMEHVLGQLCQALGLERLPVRTWSRHLTIHERVASVMGELAQRGQDAPMIVLYIPRSWFRHPEDPRRTLPDNPKSVLKALLKESLDAIVASAHTPPWLQQQACAVAEDLPMPEAGEDYLFDGSKWDWLGWGDMRSEAKRLAGIGGSGAVGRPPLVLRLGVACLSVGHSEQAIHQVFQKPDPYSDLVLMLQETLKAHREWRHALSRLSLPRFPVPGAVLHEIAGDMVDAQRALATCLLRDEELGARADEALRDIIGGARSPAPLENERLMRHYRESDGASTPREAVKKGTMRSWLEVLHHGAHLGPEAPLDTEPLSRLIHYERAWSLSVDFKEYEAAASVYRSILEDDPQDAYSHHYLAWNLDQAGKDGRTARDEYQQAIARDDDNPWYNSRYITFLRANGFRRDAHEAWERAAARVLSGKWATRVKLPAHFHYWIARTALDVGDLELSRKVMNTLTPQDFKDYPKLGKLREELAQYDEIERLGEPIYPSSVAVAKRWNEPLLLPPLIMVEAPRGRASQLREARLLDWYPGRVESIEDGKVTLILAEPNNRTLFTVEVDEQRLVGMASGEPPQIGRFLEYGGYEGQVARVRYHAPRRPLTEAEREEIEHGLRYLRDETTARGA